MYRQALNFDGYQIREAYRCLLIGIANQDHQPIIRQARNEITGTAQTP